MDSALSLRLDFEHHKIKKSDILISLNNSLLVKKLTKEFPANHLSACFNIVCLSEIPFSLNLEYTQKLVSLINSTMATGEGFSCLGSVEEIVPCYNAMLLEAYCRLGLAQSKQAQESLQWIIQYQLFERNCSTTWKHKGVCKHGGCLGKIPCYIGIGKTVRALITYNEFMSIKIKL